jgi:hypothetical protein
MFLRTLRSVLLLVSVQQIVQRRSACEAYWVSPVTLPSRQRTKNPQPLSSWSKRHERSPYCPRIIYFPLKQDYGSGNSHVGEPGEEGYQNQQLNTQHDSDTGSDPGVTVDKVDKPKTNAWTPTDVYGDLAALERVIRLGNAPWELQSSERDEKLNFLAEQCQPRLFHALTKYMILPFGLAWPIAILTRPGRSSSVLNAIAKMFVRLFDLHFLTFVVGIPIVAWMSKRICTPRQGKVPTSEQLSEMNRWYSSGLHNANERIETETSCDDPVLFLLEYWKSAVVGIAVFPLCQILNQVMGRDIFLQQSSFQSFWWVFSQFLTRIAAAASLFQFGEQMYQLQRSSQPRPVGFFPFVMQLMVRWMLVVIPLGMASDLSKIMMKLPNSAILNLYACLFIAMLETWTRMENLRIQGPLSRCFVLPMPRWKAKFMYGLSLAIIWREQTLWLLKNASSFLAKKADLPLLFERLGRMFSFRPMLVPRIFLWSHPIIRPLAHLIAVSRTLQIVYSHDLPLTLTPDAYAAALGNNDEMKRRMKWRLRIGWRRNRRLSDSVELLRTNFRYWFFVEGRVSNMGREDTGDISTLIDLIESDRRNGRGWTNRDQWKDEAMTNMAKIHQADYERNGAVNAEDPLGVAIHQTFGIGLSFLFDHTSPLKEGQEPSPRRLHARAAKSAIRRLRDLYDAESEFDERPRTVADDVSRERRRIEIKEEKEALAKRLTELIPIEESTDDIEADLDCFDVKFKKGSKPNELIVVRHPDYPYIDTPDGMIFSFDKLRRSTMRSKSISSQENDVDDSELVDFLADTRNNPTPNAPGARTVQPFRLESNFDSIKRPRSMLEDEVLAKKEMYGDSLEDRAYAVPLDSGTFDDLTGKIKARIPNAEPVPILDDITEGEALERRSEPQCDSECDDDDDPDNWEPTIVFV